VKLAEKLALVSWKFWLTILAVQVVMTAVVYRLIHGIWDVEVVVLSGAGAILAIVLMRLWARRQTRNHPAT
jgi:hypothetical protein